MKYIEIENAHVNNLKNINIRIPKQELVVITGISGSGKSSLTFDLIFEEGRKKYLQSIGMALDFGENDYTSIVGLSPTVAVKQNLIRQSNPRSTLGSKTGILNQVGLLFAKEGVSTDDSMGSIDDLDASVFSYLSPTGMCFDCGGKGKTFHMHMENIVFSNTATVEEVFKNVGSTKGFLNLLQRKYKEYFDKPFLACPDDIQDELTYGVVDNNSGKVSYCLERVLQNCFNRGEDIQALYSEETCETCQGFRVCEEAIETKINSRHVGEIANIAFNASQRILR